jgi:hypothetical protein
LARARVRQKRERKWVASVSNVQHEGTGNAFGASK